MDSEQHSGSVPVPSNEERFRKESGLALKTARFRPE